MTDKEKGWKLRIAFSKKKKKEKIYEEKTMN